MPALISNYLDCNVNSMKLLIYFKTWTVAPLKLGMDKQFRPTFYRACDYLSMLGLTLNHVSKEATGVRLNRRIPISGKVKVDRRFHRCTDIKCPLCLSKCGPRLVRFDNHLIGCMVSADYWLADYPKLKRTTQPATIGGPLGESGFCIFCSTGLFIMTYSSVLTPISQILFLLRF